MCNASFYCAALIFLLRLSSWQRAASLPLTSSDEPTVRAALDFFGLGSAASHGHASISGRQQGAGFHRVLEISVAAEQLQLVPHHGESCQVQVLLLQHLPPVLFVDPYELQQPHWHRGGPESPVRQWSAGRLSDQRVFGTIDLESPEVRAPATTLALLQTLPAASALSASFAFPLHIKYPAAQPGAAASSWWEWLLAGYVHIQVPQPRVYVKALGSCAGEGEGGRWVQLLPEQQWEQVVLRAPAGSMDHHLLVSWGTVVAAFACCGALFAGAWRWGGV